MQELNKVFQKHTKNGLSGTGVRFLFSKMIFIWVVILVLTLGISTGVFAQNTGYVKEGVYAGVTLPYNTISGDFDGNSFLASSTEFIILPKVEGGYGFGALLGIRFQKGALELSYLMSGHDTTWLGAPFTVDYNIVDINYKMFLSVNSPTQPYLLLGMGIPWMVVHDGSGSFITSAVGDATLTGIGLNIGGGLSYYLRPRICVDGGVLYRWISYSNATGVNGVSNRIDDGLGGSGLSLNVGITFTF